MCSGKLRRRRRIEEISGQRGGWCLLMGVVAALLYAFLSCLRAVVADMPLESGPCAAQTHPQNLRCCLSFGLS